MKDDKTDQPTHECSPLVDALVRLPARTQRWRRLRAYAAAGPPMTTAKDLSDPQNDFDERWAWAPSRHPETWRGAFETREQAIAAGLSKLGASARVWVRCRMNRLGQILTHFESFREVFLDGTRVLDGGWVP